MNDQIEFDLFNDQFNIKCRPKKKKRSIFFV